MLVGDGKTGSHLRDHLNKKQWVITARFPPIKLISMQDSSLFGLSPFTLSLCSPVEICPWLPAKSDWRYSTQQQMQALFRPFVDFSHHATNLSYLDGCPLARRMSHWYNMRHLAMKQPWLPNQTVTPVKSMHAFFIRIRELFLFSFFHWLCSKLLIAGKPRLVWNHSIGADQAWFS